MLWAAHRSFEDNISIYITLVFWITNLSNKNKPTYDHPYLVCGLPNSQCLLSVECPCFHPSQMRYSVARYDDVCESSVHPLFSVPFADLHWAPETLCYRYVDDRNAEPPAITLAGRDTECQTREPAARDLGEILPWDHL